MVKYTQSKSQSGLVSIMVVGIIAVLITLVVLAFSRITSRDLRQSLDRQLSSQAAYAAETGLNDTVHYIQNKLKTGAVTDQKTCDQGLTAVYPPLGANSGVGTSGATVTCILVQTTLSDTRVDNQTAGSLKVFTITNAFELSSLKISWNGGSVNSVGSPPNLPSAAGWIARNDANHRGTKPAVLRVTIMPVVNDSPANNWNKRDVIMAHARTYFLYPNFDGVAGNVGDVSYDRFGSPQNGSIIGGACNDRNTTPGNGGSSHECNVYINCLPGGRNGGGSCLPPVPVFTNPSGGSVYYVAIRPIYNDASYTINGFGASFGSEPMNIQGAQALIDVTARGTDVLKRIQARVNTSLSSNTSQQLGDAVTPDYSLESADSICKLILIPQDGTAALPGDADAACQF